MGDSGPELINGTGLNVGAGTAAVLAAAAAGGSSVVDMAADWETVYAPE